MFDSHCRQTCKYICFYFRNQHSTYIPNIETNPSQTTSIVNKVLFPLDSRTSCFLHDFFVRFYGFRCRKSQILGIFESQNVKAKPQVFAYFFHCHWESLWKFSLTCTFIANHYTVGRVGLDTSTPFRGELCLVSAPPSPRVVVHYPPGHSNRESGIQSPPGALTIFWPYFYHSSIFIGFQTQFLCSFLFFSMTIQGHVWALFYHLGCFYLFFGSENILYWNFCANVVMEFFHFFILRPFLHFQPPPLLWLTDNPYCPIYLGKEFPNCRNSAIKLL